MDERGSSNPAYLAAPAELDVFEAVNGLQEADEWPKHLDALRALARDQMPECKMGPDEGNARLHEFGEECTRYGFLVGRLTAQYLAAHRAGDLLIPTDEDAYGVAIQVAVAYFDRVEVPR